MTRRRWLFRSLIACSTLMCVLLAFLWASSYFAARGLWIAPSQTFVVRHPLMHSPTTWRVRWCTSWEGGSLAVARRVERAFRPGSRSVEFGPPLSPLPALPGTGPPRRSTFPAITFDGSVVPEPRKRSYEFSGDFYINEEPLFVRPAAVLTGERDGSIEIHVRFWQLLLLAAILPTFWLLRSAHRWRLRHGPQPGCCRACGYDLRGTPDRCPECGADPGRIFLRGKRLRVNYS